MSILTKNAGTYVNVTDIYVKQSGAYSSVLTVFVKVAGAYTAVFNGGLKVLQVLAKYGADAHMWIPGVGVVNGLDTKNWLDSTGTIPASLNNPVGKVDNAGGGSPALLSDVDAVRPVLNLDANNHYNWAFNGSFHRLSLASPIFQLTDDFCVVTGVALTTSGTERAIFAQSNASNYALPEFMFNAQGKLGVYVTGGGVSMSSYGGVNNAGTGPIVATMIKTAGDIKVRSNGSQVTSITPSGTYGTATKSAVGAFPTVTPTEHLQGSVYTTIAIKGAVSDSDLAVLEQFIALHTTL